MVMVIVVPIIDLDQHFFCMDLKCDCYYFKMWECCGILVYLKIYTTRPMSYDATYFAILFEQKKHLRNFWVDLDGVNVM